MKKYRNTEKRSYSYSCSDFVILLYLIKCCIIIIIIISSMLV